MRSSLSRIRRRGALGPIPTELLLPEVPRRRIGARELTAAAIFLGLWGGLFGLSLALRDTIPLDDLVTLIDVKDEPPPPPPPPPQKVEPPKPKEIPPPKQTPPDPDQKPPPPTPDPPPPQFGISADGTAANGGFAVATGNSLMRPADTVVKKTPPPLPPAPIASNFDVQVVSSSIPVYPAWAEEQGVGAVVDVLVTLDEKGKVSEIKVLRTGGADFDAAVKASVRASVFKPLMEAGKAVPCSFRKQYRFDPP